MKTTYYLILFIYCFASTDSKNFEPRKQDYIVQIKKQWINSVKSESHLFGLAFKRQLVSNIFLFGVTARNRADIEGFKSYFANKIEHTERREKVIVKYYTWSNRSSEKQSLERWLLKPIKYENKKQCWPYYGMDIQEAWSLGYTGLGVNVAIVDIGVDVDHPDLKRNIDLNLSYSFVDKNYSFVNPERFRDYMETEEVTSHGTMAAGLIGAEFGNQNCSAGVAFNAKLAALKVFQINKRYISLDVRMGFPFSIDKVPSALEFKRQDIDIYSCSFNLHNKYISASPEMKSALQEGVLTGRLGKGSIFVFSAGNKIGPVYDCNMEALANSIYTITISSVGKDGSIPSHAIPCATTLASTYGEFNTLRGPKTLETTSHDGMCGYFKGTSASTALASGIIALTLQANSKLTWRDVQHIIVLSSSHERLEHTGGLMKNAAGLQYNSFFGFGLMNATAMTLLAEKWLTVPPQKQTTVYETQRENWPPRQDAIAVTVQVGPCEKGDQCIKFLEHVQVELKYDKQFEAFVDILLCSPSNSCSLLLNRKTSDRTYDYKTNSYHGTRSWNYTSVQFWGENPTGQWFLIVRNSSDLDQEMFKLRKVALTLYGTPTNPSKRFYNLQWDERNNLKEYNVLNLIEWYSRFKHYVLNDLPNSSRDNTEENLKESSHKVYLFYVFLASVFIALVVIVIGCYLNNFIVAMT
ncbi:neuroendocrine convertase 2-like [Ruditapes philippinarum]|uniref:neuroendocrine convertase 2-like n=1 Tax=Ruditapes philippinarum TaxID=129788 RepID=UPI00295AFBF8|nr:neuroendocrine convertase 2-like [Ruditapes philippinarum]